MDREGEEKVKKRGGNRETYFNSKTMNQRNKRKLPIDNLIRNFWKCRRNDKYHVMAGLCGTRSTLCKC